ncbi:hypothetical protein DNTS_007825 [Danionella cerebrum]|uniref:NAD(+) kinase n=1 Tax=Danionella cerebrum TaxID=2873325 RepID=A0A553RQR4_9TELE|nr:hypothetical protein DNTS_007825 [Danionella translucida]
MLSRALRKSISCGNTFLTALTSSFCSRLCFHQSNACKVASQAESGFRPAKVAVVTKTTRYEFEQQRYRYAGLSEEDLKQLLALKGSSYSGLLERHNIHTVNVGHIVESLEKQGIEVRIVKRGEYDEETVQWADAIISAGGDGTMLLVASKVYDENKPVLGVNTDPERSEGHLCLPVRYTHAFSEALQKLRKGEFRQVLLIRSSLLWQWRQRIRMYLEGDGINPSPVDLHELQLSLEQHSQAHRITTRSKHPDMTRDNPEQPHLLPVRGLNEIFIGESLSSRLKYKTKPHLTLSLHRASYYEISIDDGPWEKQKSSGLSICTGTGSKAWSYNINKLVEQAVEDVLRIGRSKTGLDVPLNREFIESGSPLSTEYFPIVDKEALPKSKVCVRSRCWDACMVVDGGTSFEFNDGAIATISLNKADLLRTVLLD